MNPFWCRLAARSRGRKSKDGNPATSRQRQVAGIAGRQGCRDSPSTKRTPLLSGREWPPVRSSLESPEVAARDADARRPGLAGGTTPRRAGGALHAGPITAEGLWRPAAINPLRARAREARVHRAGRRYTLFRFYPFLHGRRGPPGSGPSRAVCGRTPRRESPPALAHGDAISRAGRGHGAPRLGRRPERGAPTTVAE